MKKYKNKKLLKDGLIGFIQKIIIMVLITIALVFTVSLFVDRSFRTLLEYTSYIIIILGGLSAMGSRSRMVDQNYNFQRVSTGLLKTAKHDLDSMLDSYRFCIFMGISGLIMLLIALAL